MCHFAILSNNIIATTPVMTPETLAAQIIKLLKSDIQYKYNIKYDNNNTNKNILYTYYILTKFIYFIEINKFKMNYYRIYEDNISNDVNLVFVI